MKIAVDAGCLGITDKRLEAGVYRVVENLLIEISKIDKENTYILYSFVPINKTLLEKLGPNFTNKVILPMRGWNKIWLPIELLRHKPDIFLGLNQSLPLNIPLVSKYKKISMIYDIGYEKYKDTYSQTYHHLKKITTCALKYSDSVITISQSAKEDLVNYYHVKKSKIIVAYPGIDKGMILSNTKKSEDDYFLFLGSLKRSKNVSSLISAFDVFCQKNDKPKYKLIIAGGDKWMDIKIKDSLKNIGKNTKEKIIFKGHISENEKKDLYDSAIAFVSPSIYEGFGLPFLEAMACGCPVIGSNRGGIPEVVGDAGVLVDPFYVHGLADAMAKVAENKEMRDEMIQKGLRQAKKFSWESFAQQVYEVINTV